MTQTKNPHVLETESIGKLLIQYSIPAIIAMTVTSVYLSLIHISEPTRRS